MKKIYRAVVKWVNDRWRDPVWSKVFSAIIIAMGTSVLSFIWLLVQKVFEGRDFLSSFAQLRAYLTTGNNQVNYRLIILLGVFIVLSLTLPVLIRLLIQKYSTERNEEHLDANPKDLPEINERSTVFFEYRMADAFPGLRGLKWFEGKEAAKRLGLLLKDPMHFSSKSPEVNNPVWWFRGSKNYHIRKFKAIKNNKILINHHEHIIARIAVYRADTPMHNFIYVETSANAPTGVYPKNEDASSRRISLYGYDYEEYGIFNGKYKISREQYDDGAAEIKGKVIAQKSAELRVRYLSPYNFVIAAVQSPVNSREFDRYSEAYLNGIQKGTKKIEDLVGFIGSLTESLSK